MLTFAPRNVAAVAVAYAYRLVPVYGLKAFTMLLAYYDIVEEARERLAARKDHPPHENITAAWTAELSLFLANLVIRSPDGPALPAADTQRAINLGVKVFEDLHDPTYNELVFNVVDAFHLVAERSAYRAELKRCNLQAPAAERMAAHGD